MIAVHFFVITIFTFFFLELSNSLDSERFNNFDLTDSLNYWFHEVDRDADATVEGDGRVILDRPFLFKNRLTGREAIICLPSSVDRIHLARLLSFSTTFIASSFRDTVPKIPPSTNGNDELFFDQLRKSWNSMDEKGKTEQKTKFAKAFLSTEVPRILFVQNPYLHFIRQQQQSHSINDSKTHTPLHQTCLLDSMAYDYVFPAEELNCWVSPLFRSLNLATFGASADWTLYNLNRDNIDKQDSCFYHLPGYTCQAMIPVALSQLKSRTQNCLLSHHPVSFSDPVFPLSTPSASSFSSFSLPLVNAEEEIEVDLPRFLEYTTSRVGFRMSEQEMSVLQSEANRRCYRVLPSFPQLLKENVNSADWELRSILTQLLRPSLGPCSGGNESEYLRRRVILEGFRLLTTTPQPALTLAHVDLHLPFKIFDEVTKINESSSRFDGQGLLDPWLTHWPRILTTSSASASEHLPLNTSAPPTHQRTLLPSFVSYLPVEEQQKDGSISRHNASSQHRNPYVDYQHNVTIRHHLEGTISYVQGAHLSSLLNNWVGSRMHDGVPFLFINRFTGKRAVICLHPKAGSSSLKFLLRYGSVVSGRHYRPHYTSKVNAKQLQSSSERALHKQILSESPHSQKTTAHTALLSALLDPSVPRIMLVRNPFVRFLSGFLDKILRLRDYENFAPPGYKTNETDFVRFAKLMTAFHHMKEVEAGYHEMKEFNDHFRLMAGNCLVPQGVLYDYVLPLEQMPCWYEPLLAALQLDELSKSGWNETTPRYQGATSCFYQKPGAKSCDDMFQEGIWQRAATACQRPKTFPAEPSHPPDTTKTSKDSPNAHTYHATSSVSKLPPYYQPSSVSGNELVRHVAQWLQPDLHALRYPLWRPDLNESAAQYLDKLCYFE